MQNDCSTIKAKKINKVLRGKELSSKISKKKSKALSKFRKRLIDNQFKRNMDEWMQFIDPIAEIHKHSNSEILGKNDRQMHLGLYNNIVQKRSISVDEHLPGYCGLTVIKPPYEWGFPLNERVGSQMISPAVDGDFTTESALSNPRTGQLSIGAGLGAVPNTGPTIHLPEFISGGPAFGHRNSANAGLGTYVCLPLMDFDNNSIRIDISATLTVGNPSAPAYVGALNYPGATYGLILYGNVYLTSIGLSSDPVTNRKGFLSFFETHNGIINDRIAREVFITQTHIVDVRPDFLFVSVDVDIGVSKFMNPSGLHDDQVNGFGIIDLRSPDEETTPIHFIARQGGPIYVPEIKVTFCNQRTVGFG